MEIKIVIPSHLRADRVVTTRAVADPIICVPDSQGEQYRQHNAGVEIVTHPDSVRGIAQKRQWIYTHFGSVFMIDDDIAAMERVWVPPGDDSMPKKMEPEEARAVIEETADLTRDAGAYLFGFAPSPDPALYNPLKPIRLTGYILAGAFGLLKGSRLCFPTEEDCVVEDYFLCCLNAYYHRYCIIDRRFAIRPKATFHNVGGLAAYRTIDAERRGYEFLRRMFGNVIQPKGDRPNTKNPERQTRRTHQWERVMRLPF